MNNQTKDQIAAIMLLTGTPEQQLEALEYCSTSNKSMTNQERILKFNNEHGYGRDKDLLFIKKLRYKLTGEQIAFVLDVIETTCKHCYDSDEYCSCWNDQ